MSSVRISQKVNGGKLRQLRESLGWTQQMAADRAGYSSRLIRKLECGGPVESQTLHDVLEAYRETADRKGINTLVSTKELYLSSLLETSCHWLQAAFLGNVQDSNSPFIRAYSKLFAAGACYRGKVAIHSYFQNLASQFKPENFQFDRRLVDGQTLSLYWSFESAMSNRFRDVQACDDESQNQHQRSAAGLVRGNTLLIVRKDYLAEIRQFFDARLEMN